MSPSGDPDMGRTRFAIRVRHARAAACVVLAFVVLAFVAASCNAILGLDPVHRADDGGAGGGGSVGSKGGSGGSVAGAAGAGGPSCGWELSTDGDFDVGMKPWNEAPTGTVLVRAADDPEVQAHGVTPLSGTNVLRLGAPSTGYLVHYVEQYAEIPADALEVTISGYLQVRSEEDMERVYDTAYVQLFEERRRGSPFFTSDPPWSNLTPAADWTRFALPLDVTSMAGKEMVFQIVADLDNGGATYFYFDNVSVAVTRCLP
jgi:hypothetical protein